MLARTSLIAPVALAAALAWCASLAGCEVSAPETSAPAGHPTVDASYLPTPLDAGDVTDAAVDVRAASTKGSPLCHWVAGSSLCFPDDPETSGGCELAPDGGTYQRDAGTDDIPMACHVPPSTPTSTADAMKPVCLPAGPGLQGDPCLQSTDCAPRHECVAEGGGLGTCRRYCCSGNGSCGAAAFCDIRPMVGTPATNVPVCVPIVPAGGCPLLGDACAPTQTCAVVGDNGATSCVDVGSGGPGDPCDVVHCGANLVCLGATGQRLCYPLCHTATPGECPAPTTCRGGLPLFPDSRIGVCQ